MLGRHFIIKCMDKFKEACFPLWGSIGHFSKRGSHVLWRIGRKVRSSLD